MLSFMFSIKVIDIFISKSSLNLNDQNIFLLVETFFDH